MNYPSASWVDAAAVQIDGTVRILVRTSRFSEWRLPDETELDDLRRQGITGDRFA